MKVKELREYLKEFNDNDTVCVSGWFSDGAKYYIPNIPCCPPIKFNAETHKESIAVVGCFDNCLAHQVFRGK